VSGSGQHHHAGLVSVNILAIIGGTIHENVLDVDIAKRWMMRENAQQLLRRLAQFTKPDHTIQGVCDHPAQIIE